MNKKFVICKKEFDEKNYKVRDYCHYTGKYREAAHNIFKNYKVRDHCHYTGKYREAAHNIFNLRYKIPKEIPVVFHNGSTYDYHFIIK